MKVNRAGFTVMGARTCVAGRPCAIPILPRGWKITYPFVITPEPGPAYKPLSRRELLPSEQEGEDEM